MEDPEASPTTLKHEHPRYALSSIQCAPVDSCGRPHWKCVRRICSNCPTYQIPDVEKEENAGDIRFHIYLNVSKCHTHGVLPAGSRCCPTCDNENPAKISTRRQLTLMEKPIGVFLQQFYIPMLYKYAFHRPHVMILGKNSTGRAQMSHFKQTPNAVKTIRDYAERLKFELNQEIQSEHFGNSRTLSIEGCSCRYMKDDVCYMEMHSHFSDDKRQDSRTTHRHMLKLFDQLTQQSTISPKNSLWIEDTDGAAKQYRSGTALYLLSLLAATKGVIVDRAIGAPGHGKDEVDGLNVVDKRFIQQKMAILQAPGVNESENRMRAEAYVDGVEVSTAKEAARLCSEESRITGVKSERKYQSRESKASMTQRYYWVDEGNTQFENLKMSVKPFGNKEMKDSISYYYNFRADPKLGLLRIAARRIPCACESCIEMLNAQWVDNVDAEEQTRYSRNERCALWDIFEGLNDWHILNLQEAKGNNPEENLQAQELVVDSWVQDLRPKIHSGCFGAQSTVDGFELVRFLSEPFQATTTMVLDEYNPPIEIETGEWIVKALYYNSVPRAARWFTPSEDRTRVRVQQVLATDLKMEEEHDNLQLPRACNRRQARQKGAYYLPLPEYNMVMDEVSRRQLADFIEEHDDIAENSDEDPQLSDEDESGDDGSESD